VPQETRFVSTNLPDFDEASIAAHYLLRDEDDQPMGRLHVSIDPQRFVKDNAPLYAMTLVARGTPKSPDLGAAVALLDKGHKAIVNGFTTITTEEMQTVWERTQ
jgi:hypothetical protein